MCAGGVRSSTASSILLRNGYRRVHNIRGGMGALKKSFDAGSQETKAFVLRSEQDLKIREIATILDRPRSTVQDALNRVHRAVKDS